MKIKGRVKYYKRRSMDEKLTHATQGEATDILLNLIGSNPKRRGWAVMLAKKHGVDFDDHYDIHKEPDYFRSNK